MKKLFAILCCLSCLVSCDSGVESGTPVSPAGETLRVYNWPGAKEAVEMPLAEIREYIDSCELILRVSCEDEYELSADTETKLTRRYRVLAVVSGNVPVGSTLQEHYYLEQTPQEIQQEYGIAPQQLPCTEKVSYPQLQGWLCLRRSFLTSNLEIDRSEEAYAYPYFLYGAAVDDWMQNGIR